MGTLTEEDEELVEDVERVLEDEEVVDEDEDEVEVERVLELDVVSSSGLRRAVMESRRPPWVEVDVAVGL